MPRTAIWRRRPPRLRLGPTVTGVERLRCVECGREAADDKRGWRAFLTVDDAPEDRTTFAFRAPLARLTDGGVRVSACPPSASA
jgi:hypothetical protein